MQKLEEVRNVVSAIIRKYDVAYTEMGYGDIKVTARDGYHSASVYVKDAKEAEKRAYELITLMDAYHEEPDVVAHSGKNALA